PPDGHSLSGIYVYSVLVPGCLRPVLRFTNLSSVVVKFLTLSHFSSTNEFQRESGCVICGNHKHNYPDLNHNLASMAHNHHAHQQVGIEFCWSHFARSVGV